jgi:hypothetical protein
MPTKFYPLEPTEGQVQSFRDAWNAADARGETGNRVRAGLRAVLNPAQEVMPCGDGLVEWACVEGRLQVLGHKQCALLSGHRGEHVTPDGRTRWTAEDDDAD